MRRWTGAAAAAGVAAWLAAGIAAGMAATVLTDADRREVVEEAQRLLEAEYVLPEVAARVNAELGRRLADGAFADADEPQELADGMTRLLQELTHDIHLRVTVAGEGGQASPGAPVRIVRRVAGGDEGEGGPGGDGEHRGPGVVVRRVMPDGDVDVDMDADAPMPGGDEPDGPAVPPGLADIDAFPDAHMLPGNVGYVKIDLFSGFPGAWEKAEARMAQLAGADAVIFDLRQCRGGFPEMVHFVTSYLYDEKPRHLLTYYHAHTPPESAYTLAEVPGERLPNADAYILTSGFTASGGEEFTYVLKHHGRATVVGEKTVGAGHGGGTHPLPHGLSIFVPVFRPVHPVTGKGWEAEGVVPDIDVPASRALDAAYREALRKQRGRRKDAAERKTIETELARLEAALAEPLPDTDGYDEYVGKYDIRTVSLGSATLYIQRVGGPRLVLVPGGERDLFHPEIAPEGGVRFVRDDAGKVVAVEARMPGSAEWMRSWRDGVTPR